MNINELEKRELHLIGDLVVIREKIYQAKLEQHGLIIGCIVIHEGEEFKVTNVEFKFKKPWIYGYKKTKKGEWSHSIKCIFDEWELK